MNIIREKETMQKRPLFREPQKSGKAFLTPLSFVLLLSIMTVFLSSCGGNTPLQQQTNQDRMHLQQALQQAENIGVPLATLKPITSQVQTLNQTNAPWTLFSDQSTKTYFQNLIIRYQQLTLQTQAVMQVSTEQSKEQAQTNLLSLQKGLALDGPAHMPVDVLSQVYNQQLLQFNKATTPREFTAISSRVHDADATLNMLPHTMDALQSFADVLQLLKSQHQDITTPQQQYDDDNKAISAAMTPASLQQVEQQIDSQNQQLATQYQNVIPDLVTTRINELAANVQLMQQQGINVTAYQADLDADRTQGSQVKTMQDFLAFTKKITADKATMQMDLLKGQSMQLVKQFHNEVNVWGNAHLYHDTYDGKDYPLDNSYMAKGIGEDLDRYLSTAVTADDYQQLIATTQNELFHLHMFEQEYIDKTPFDQVHQTDIQLLQHYQLMNSQVIIVSTAGQALRLYQNGKLVKGFLVTAGRPELPTVPGLWSPLWRLTNTEFHSPYPPGSQYYYEPTKINYAILYHEGGYYLHDSWWRNDYGPGTQFYHIDSSGNVSASYGTHGCVNIREDQAAWLYGQTSYSTSILIY